MANHNSAPNFYGTLRMQPNPDVILRKLGKSQEVFDAVIVDPYVMSERRSTHSVLLSYEYRLQPGDAPLQILAPMNWAGDEVVWEKRDGLFLPVNILDLLGRQFLFSHDGQLRVKANLTPRWASLFG